MFCFTNFLLLVIVVLVAASVKLQYDRDKAVRRRAKELTSESILTVLREIVQDERKSNRP